jgi:DNA-binding Xre family transcriptional regulator
VPLQWTLRKWLAVTHDIYRPADVRRRILEATGIDLTAQALSSLMTGKPRALRLSTIEAICSTFQCKLSDFCEVVPATVKKRAPRQLYPGHGRRTKRREVTAFPDPDTFAEPTNSRGGTKNRKRGGSRQ